MSNFLNKFTDQNYQDTVTDKENPNQAEKGKEEDKIKKSKPVKKLEEVETKIVSEPTPSPRRSEYVEETIKDPGYKRQRMTKIIIGSLVAVILVALGITGFYMMNQVRVPDYVNQPISELKTWASRNNITLDIEEVFSLEVTQDYVISTEPLENSKIQKGSIVSVVVSKGSDPEEVLVIPDFTGVSSMEIQNWIDMNQAYNLRMSYEYSTDIEASMFIRLKFSDNATTSETYQRQDYAIVYISNGPEVFEKNIKVPDWTTTHKLISEVSSWATTNSITLTIEKEFSTLAVDSVIRQSISADTLVAKNDKMTIVISKGISVLVPDFKPMNMTDANAKIAELNGLSNVTAKLFEMYNDTNGYGSYIWQDVNPGVKIDQTSTNEFKLNVYFSLGRPYITSQVGSNEATLTQYFYELNLKSANLTYTVAYKNCTSITGAVKGNVCYMSKFNEYVNVGTAIDIIVHDPNSSLTY